MKTFIFIFFTSFLFQIVLSDLPVHCPKSEIIGEWVLETTANIKAADGRVLCGHDSPGKASTSAKALLEGFEVQNTFSLVLKEDFSVALKQKNTVFSENLIEKDEEKEEKGVWNIIYDEGFEIEFNGTKYFAFSSYTYNDQNPSKSISHCEKTLVGWYISVETQEKGCYRAHKENFTSENVTNFQEISTKKLVKPIFSLYSIEEVHRKNVKNINSQQKSWEAAIDPMFARMSFNELNSFAGRKKQAFTEEITREFNNENNKGKNKRNSHKNNKKDDAYKHFSRENIDDLPKELNWTSLIQPSGHQGNCGSCYVFSAMEMAQARIKKNYNETVKLSVQYSLNCNYFNQGCDGGYPTLVHKFGSEFEYIEENCLKYTAKNGKCSDSCDISLLKKVYRVKKYWFVGGHYGLSSERLMMIELMNNGPFAVSFEPAMDFMYYRKGIYHSVIAANWILKGKTQPDWEKVDHSVLLVGWGEENGEKYWILQNSWGENWGENGLFRMRRGTDESAIESMGEAVEMEIVERKTAKQSFLKKSK